MLHAWAFFQLAWGKIKYLTCTSKVALVCLFQCEGYHCLGKTSCAKQPWAILWYLLCKSDCFPGACPMLAPFLQRTSILSVVVRASSGGLDKISGFYSQLSLTWIVTLRQVALFVLTETRQSALGQLLLITHTFYWVLIIIMQKRRQGCCYG